MSIHLELNQVRVSWLGQKSSQISKYFRFVAFVMTLMLMNLSSFAEEANSLVANKWDASLSAELKEELIKLHNAWNTMDVKLLERSLVGDDILATFDLDPESSRPIKLTSKDDVLKYVDTMFRGYKEGDTKTIAEHPMIACRASSTFGVCTEECRVQILMPNGMKQVQSLRATVVAIKEENGWKWIHWHMSEAAPRETFDQQGKIIQPR